MNYEEKIKELKEQLKTTPKSEKYILELKIYDLRCLRAKDKWDALKGIKFIHRDDPKKTVMTIESVKYPTDYTGKPDCYACRGWGYLVYLNWEDKKKNAIDYFQISHAQKNFKEGVWIKVD